MEMMDYIDVEPETFATLTIEIEEDRVDEVRDKIDETEGQSFDGNLLDYTNLFTGTDTWEGRDVEKFGDMTTGVLVDIDTHIAYYVQEAHDLPLLPDEDMTLILGKVKTFAEGWSTYRELQEEDSDHDPNDGSVKMSTVNIPESYD